MVEIIDIGSIVASGFALITAIIYATIFLFVFKDRNKTFSTSFYQMFLVLAAVDLLAILNNFIGVSLPAWRVFQPFDDDYLKIIHPNVTLTITWFCRYAQGFSVITIASNRATAFLWPLRHEKIWRHRYARKIWLLQVVPAFLVALVVLFIMKKKYDIFPDRELRYVLTIFAEQEQRIQLYRYSYIVEGIKLFLMFSTQGFYIVQVCCRCREVTKTSNAEKSAANLIFYVFCVEIIYLAYTGLMVLLVPIPSPDSTSLNSIITDFYSSINCYFAIFFSKTLRASLQQVSLGFKRKRTLGELYETSARLW